MTEKICRLCLQTIIKNYETIEENLLKTLKMNLNITKENVTCTECASYLQAFSNFKTASVYRRNIILPLPKLENDANLDLKPHVETEIKCSFCAKTDGKGGVVLLNASKKYESLVDMLKQHIPEMNLNITEELLTCGPCLDALQSVVSFILKCLEVEEEINRYVEMEGADVKGQVELKDVRQFRCRSTIKLETEPFDENELGDGCSGKIKKEYATVAEAKIKYEKKLSDSEVVIKTEVVDIKSEQSDCDSYQDPSIKNKIDGASLEMSVVVPETRHEKIGKRRKRASKIKMFKCETCSYETKIKSHLTAHLLIHKSPSETNMFKCAMCSYETKIKSYLKQHLLRHKRRSKERNVNKCEICPYVTFRKYFFEQHLLTHRSPSDINILMCKTCSYVTEHKHSLKTHLLTHKIPVERNTFKCGMCPFEAKRKLDLYRHLSTHSNNCSEVKIFKRVHMKRNV